MDDIKGGLNGTTRAKFRTLKVSFDEHMHSTFFSVPMREVVHELAMRFSSLEWRQELISRRRSSSVTDPRKAIDTCTAPPLLTCLLLLPTRHHLQQPHSSCQCLTEHRTVRRMACIVRRPRRSHSTRYPDERLLAAARTDNEELLLEVFEEGKFDINFQDGCVRIPS